MTEQIKDEVTGLVRSINLVKKTLSADDGDLLIDALIEELGKLKSNRHTDFEEIDFDYSAED